MFDERHLCVSGLLQYPIIYEGFSTIWGLYDCDALVYVYYLLLTPVSFVFVHKQNLKRYKSYIKRPVSP